MREILFRGKRICDDEWIEGCFGRYYNGESDVACISIPSKGFFGYSSYEVDPEAVGQYTGLTDKNGVKIFEGDIVRLWGNGNNLKGVVEYSEAVWWVRLKECRTYLLDLYGESVIIGNIYDNPELIEGEDDAEMH